MTFDEALEAIGVEPGVDDKALRRAYLRAVKAHPPERDPDGFQRVRAAYELLQAQLPYHVAGAGEERSDDYAAADEDQSFDVEGAREESLYWRLMSEPSDVDDAELEAVELGEVGDAVAYAWLERGRPVAAGRALSQQLTLQRERGTLPPSGHILVKTLLTLLAKKKPNAFDKLLREMRVWLRGHGRPEVFAGHTLAVWSLLDELSRVRKRLDPELVAVMARAMLDGDVPWQDAALSDYRRKHRRAAHKAARLLEREAPGLHGQFGGALGRGNSAGRVTHVVPERGIGRGGGWPIYIFVIFAMNAARVCSSEDRRSTRQADIHQLTTYAVDAGLPVDLVVIGALDRGDCDAARAALVSAYMRPLRVDERRRVDLAEARIVDECPSTTEGGR